jgi:glucan phosphorylase
VLAGDYLKTLSDLSVMAISIGLLYREGYFRQIIDAAGWQRKSYPFNDPRSMPIRPGSPVGFTPPPRCSAKCRPSWAQRRRFRNHDRGPS